MPRKGTFRYAKIAGEMATKPTNTGSSPKLIERLKQRREENRSTKTVEERLDLGEAEIDGHTAELMVQGGKLSDHEERIQALEQGGDDDRVSETSFSFHPTAVRVKGKNWAPSNYVLITLVVAGAIVAIVWLLHK
jgi:hypothetical protein